VPDTQKSVDCNVTHTGQEVLIDLDPFIGVMGIKVVLKIVEGEGVAFLMHRVSISVLDLQALIGQVHKIVFVL
jgi:hypothetical protein